MRRDLIYRRTMAGDLSRLILLFSQIPLQVIMLPAAAILAVEEQKVLVLTF